METSDSEYFESADEDFESEEEFNKNKASVKSNVIKTNLIEGKNEPHILSEIHQNKDTNVETTNVNRNVRKNSPSAINENDKTEVVGKKALDSLETCANDNVNKDGIQRIQPELCLDKGDNLDSIEENLWNDEEGWGVNDENDTEEHEPNFKKINCNRTVDDGKNTTTKEASSKEKQIDEKNMWDNDDEWDNWESVNEVKVDENKAKLDAANSDNSTSNQIWKGWSNWGVTSILSTASQSVSTLTHSVSQGLSTVLETGIGAPDPEKLAMLNHAEKNQSQSAEPPTNQKETNENKNILGFGLNNIGNLVSGMSKLVETTSTKVISGGLDTLETIGKKTMEVIQDGDPGLKRKRAFLNLEGEKPILSQVLREAKEKSEQENKLLQEKHFTKKVNYESIFDDHQGLVHLEALEMLSKQCDMKLQLLIESNSGKALTDIQETLDQVKELCELPDEEEDEQITTDELKEKLKSAVDEIGINISYNRLIALWEETECWLNNNTNICDEHEMHQQAVETLAQLTAIAVEQFHKGGELLLIKDHHSTADEADSLVQLTTTLTSLLGIVAAKFSDKMNAKVTEISNKENINSLITNIFFEAANSSSYVQDAFQLLVPVLQIGAV